jgi:peptidoglycan/xylan/chitin deacetylase (PgdA/CDA1 family)
VSPVPQGTGDFVRPRRAALTQPVRKALGELFLSLMRFQGNGVSRFPILAYHSIADMPGLDVETVAPSDFGEQMAWLASRRFEVVTVSELVQRMARPSGVRPMVAITFDDGYRDNIVAALPILQRYGFTASFYVASGYIGRQSGWNPVDYIGHRPMLTSRDIRMLSDSGQEIGSHTHSHTDLTRIDAALLDEELDRSRRILGDITGKPVVAFAPPYGRSNDTVVARVAHSGYTHLVKGGRFTSNPKGASPFDLRRITVARWDSVREFARKVSGAYQWLAFRDR